MILPNSAHGLILIELERRVPIDLLPDREAATLENWLVEVLPVLVLTSTEYAQQEEEEVEEIKVERERA